MVPVGLTGADALASIGVIGATAAIVFLESSDSLTIGNEGGRNSENSFSNNLSIIGDPGYSKRLTASS